MAETSGNSGDHSTAVQIGLEEFKALREENQRIRTKGQI